MTTMPGKNGKAMAPPPDITAQLAHHDAAIGALGGRMTGVEQGLKTLQGEVHAGFSNVTHNVNQHIGNLASKIDRLDARPTFDFHKVVGTVVSLAVLFGMICGGIIYINNAQNAALVAEQKVFNSTVAKALEKHDDRIDRNEGEIAVINSWRATIVPARGR